MKRILIEIEYDGKDFFGWQKQEGKRCVQSEIECVLHKLTGEKIEIYGSGRTDKGVHAMGQCAHFDISVNFPTKNIPTAMNNLLPSDISVKKAVEKNKKFHARFSAKQKTYQYQIYHSIQKQALKNNRFAYVNYDLNLEKMKEVSKILEGRHNFKGFCSTNTQVKDFEREIKSIKITQRKNEIIVEVCGNGFLYNMVRIIVGTLVDVGRGLLNETDVKNALEKKERSFAGQTMPPEGLFLKKVKY